MVFMNQNYSSIYSILIYMMIIGAAIDKSRLVGVKTLLIALNYKKKKINVRLDKFFFFFHCLLHPYLHDWGCYWRRKELTNCFELQEKK